MTRSSCILLLVASALLLLCSGTSAFSSTEFATATRAPVTAPRYTSRKKFVTSEKSSPKSKTCLTSKYRDAKQVAPVRWPTLVASYKPRPLRWVSKLIERTGASKRLVIGSILAAMIIFAPAFSPAARAASIAEGARGVTPVAMPFSSKSRALGTFNILPSRAELELCFRLLYSACLGAYVGLERSSSDRPAGVRTMALVGLGACTYTICSTHGFLPHLALGAAPGSPILDSVKVDLSRMAASIASGVGFIGAGAIHKHKQAGGGSDVQNVVAGLTTAAAVWVSAAVGIASAVGLYFVGAVSTFTTVGILKYARVPKEEEREYACKPKPLVEVDQEAKPQEKVSRDNLNPPKKIAPISGLFGTIDNDVESEYSPQEQAFVDSFDSYARDAHPIIIKEVIDPRFEKYLRSRLAADQVRTESKILIEEEQEVKAHGSSNTTDGKGPSIGS